ncbi:MAG: MFS transporter [Mogibacterium sp.]|nr:MFS transporter [Mogibacterium sp.]
MSEANASQSKKGLMIFATLFLMVGMMMASYSSNVLLPSELMKFADPTDTMYSLIYAFMAAIASTGMMIALPISGSLSAKFGAKTIILFGILAQFACKLAIPFIGSIVPFGIVYFLMGFFGGLFMAAPYSVMAELVTPQERPKYFGFLAAMSAVGALLGPLLTGIVSAKAGAKIAWPFYAVFLIIPFVLFLLFYPNRKRPGMKFDFLGMLYLAIFVIPLIFWLSLGGGLFKRFSGIGLGLLALAIVALVLLIKRETTIEGPAVPLKMFAKPRFRTTFIVAALIVAYATTAGAYGIRYAQQVMGVSQTVSSTVTMPQTVVQFIVGLVIGGIIGKQFKKKFRAVGLLSVIVYIVALLIMWSLKPDSPIALLLLATGIGGIGQGISQSQYAAFFQTELKMEEIRPAQGMYQFSQTGFSSIITAVYGLAQGLGAQMHDLFLIGALICALGLVVAFIGFRFPKEEIEAEAAALAGN